MSKQNETPKSACRCAQTACGCASASTERCTCGESCKCEATCRCGAGCGCGTKK